VRASSLFRRSSIAVASFCFVLASSAAHACSCTGSGPVQKSDPYYAGQAVFTARVVALLGKVYRLRDGKRYSSITIAHVQTRHWGLPWYWPKFVILNGQYPCDYIMAENEDYLVVGRLERYGVLNVAGCSGTQPLNTAQVSLRTLDGSHCAAPGGSIIGQVLQGQYHKLVPVENAAITFRNSIGDTHTTRTGHDGVYELRNLPRGHYSLVDPRFDSGKYASGAGTVLTGRCADIPIYVKTYSLTGRLPVGANYSVALTQGVGRQWHADIGSGGRFYFEAVPPGDYQLVASGFINGQPLDSIYFPGVRDPRKARTIHVTSAGLPDQSFDFQPDAFQPAPIRIPIVVEAPAQTPSVELPIVLYIYNSAGRIVSQIYGWTGIPTEALGTVGETYGFSAYLTNSDGNPSIGPSISVKATAAMQRVRLHLGRPRTGVEKLHHTR
jgi:hypothetical protein